MGYRVASTHVEDTAAGAVFGPGEAAVVDPSDPYDAAKIEAGLFVETDDAPVDEAQVAPPAPEVPVEQTKSSPAVKKAKQQKEQS